MSWLQTAKDVAELVQKLDNIDLLRKVMTLQTELMEMQDQIFKLREENAQLRHVDDVSENITYDHATGWYYVQRDGRTDGPFCPTCWDDRRKLIRPATMPNRDFGRCTVCQRGGSMVARPDQR